MIMYTVNNRVLAHAGWALCLCRDVSCRSFSYSLLHKSSAPPCRRSLALRYRSTALTTPYTINPATSNQLLFHFQPVSAPPLSIRQTPIRPFTRLNADNPPKHPKIRVKRERRTRTATERCALVEVTLYQVCQCLRLSALATR